MIIGFDASKIPYPHRRGWGQYSLQLIQALSRVDHENTYKLFYNHLRRASRQDMFRGPIPQFKNRLIPLPAGILDRMWMNREMPKIEWFLGRVDIFHSPFERLPPARCRKLATIHDLIYLRFPELHGESFYRDSSERLKKICERADLIVAVSDNTREDICDFTRIPPERIRVVPDGVHERFRPAEQGDREHVLLRYNLPNAFLLYIGAATPHKNLDRLIEAFKILVDSGLTNYSLVFAGNLRWGYDHVMTKARELGIWDKTRFLGYVPDPHLPALYSAATLFVFPSLYEGFGMPILEAMASGTVVACSDIKVFREVAGEAALFFDPERPEEISSTVYRILYSSALREDLLRKGMERAEGFRWRHIAQRVVRLYEEIC